MGVPGLWGSHIVMQGEQDGVHSESSLQMESKSDICRVMLRHYSPALVSPLPVPWNWHCASRQCRQAIVRSPRGHGAGADTQQHRERSPKGLTWKKPLLPCYPRGTEWRLGYLSNWELHPGLSPAGRGRTWSGSRARHADSHVRWCRAVPAPQCWMGNCLHPLQWLPDAQEQDFLLLFHQAWGHPFSIRR